MSNRKPLLYNIRQLRGFSTHQRQTGRPCMPMSSFACSITAVLGDSPPSIRASSWTLSIAGHLRMVERVEPPATSLYDHEMGVGNRGNLVQVGDQTAWACAESSLSLCAIMNAVWPLMPESISSKSRVPSWEVFCRTLMASMIRLSSPPEAILARGSARWPTFVEM